MLDDRHRDPGDVALLKRVRPDQRRPHLTGDAHERRRVHPGIRDRRHEVRGARARRRDRNADATGRAGIPLCHVPRALLVAGQDVANRRAARHGVVGRHDRTAGNPEHHLDALGLQRAEDRVCSRHLHLSSFGFTVPRPFSGCRDGDAGACVSVAVCTSLGSLATGWYVGDISLARENGNELDAYAARSRTAVNGSARIAVGHGYGEAEHRLRSMPEPGWGRKEEPSGTGRWAAARRPCRQPHRHCCKLHTMQPWRVSASSERRDTRGRRRSTAFSGTRVSSSSPSGRTLWPGRTRARSTPGSCGFQCPVHS